MTDNGLRHHLRKDGKVLVVRTSGLGSQCNIEFEEETLLRLIAEEQRALLERCLQTHTWPNFPATSSKERAVEIAINVQNELKALKQLEEPQA